MTETTEAQEEIRRRQSEGWKRPAAIEDVPPGTEAWCWSTGALRLVTVESAARTRVTVTFTQKNGTARTKAVRFDDLLVPDLAAERRLVAPAWVRTHHDRRTLVVGTEDVAVWRTPAIVWHRDEAGKAIGADWTTTEAYRAKVFAEVLDDLERSRPGLWRTRPALVVAPSPFEVVAEGVVEDGVLTITASDRGEHLVELERTYALLAGQRDALDTLDYLQDEARAALTRSLRHFADALDSLRGIR